MEENKIGLYWERLAIYVCGLLVALCGYLYMDQKDRITNIESTVQTLQIEKVSRQELKDMETRLTGQMAGMKGDIIYHINMLREAQNNRK